MYVLYVDCLCRYLDDNFVCRCRKFSCDFDVIPKVSCFKSTVDNMLSRKYTIYDFTSYSVKLISFLYPEKREKRDDVFVPLDYVIQNTIFF